MGRIILALVLFVSISACSLTGSHEASSDEHALADTGHRVAQLKCARCHSIEPTGESRNPRARPFREISHALTTTRSDATLADGIRAGHLDMPPLNLSQAEIAALNAYLQEQQ